LICRNPETREEGSFCGLSLNVVSMLIVRREEHTALGQKVFKLEKEIREKKSKIGV
jgi:hypothetical protein